MDKKERAKHFEDWLSAYTNHLHMVRQGTAHNVVHPDPSKPPHPTGKHLKDPQTHSHKSKPSA